jgi:hypothetical protein
MTYYVRTPLAKNAIVTVAAFMVGYVIMTATMAAELEFSTSGELFHHAAEGTTPEFSDDEDPFEAMEQTVNRYRFIYLPAALLLPALLIALLTSNWQWSWLLTALACSLSLVSLVVLSSDNLGYGLAIGLTMYAILALLVTSLVYLRERSAGIKA